MACVGCLLHLFGYFRWLLSLCGVYVVLGSLLGCFCLLCVV